MCEGLGEKEAKEDFTFKIPRRDFSSFSRTQKDPSWSTHRSLEEYCLERAERSLSLAPWPPLAVSHVGLAAVVMVPEGN